VTERRREILVALGAAGVVVWALASLFIAVKYW
jgi:hypothetical protein